MIICEKNKHWTLFTRFNSWFSLDWLVHPPFFFTLMLPRSLFRGNCYCLMRQLLLSFYAYYFCFSIFILSLSILKFLLSLILLIDPIFTYSKNTEEEPVYFKCLQLFLKLKSSFYSLHTSSPSSLLSHFT